MTLFLIALGGGIGATIRFLLSRYNGNFPFGTLAANGMASLSIGFLIPFLQNENVIAFFIVGICGAMSTVSTFALEMNTQPKPLRYGLLTWLVTAILVTTGYMLSPK